MPVWNLIHSGRLYHCLKVMLVFCDITLVFMEMTFVQYVSLGPITIWKAVPLCKVKEMIFTRIICQNALLAFAIILK